MQVFKKDGSVLWTAKAYNGRVISEWLQRCLTDCFLRSAEYPDVEGQVPLLCSALPHVWIDRVCVFRFLFF